jgi:DNA-binding transcriptional ArsR family regulator
MLRRLDLASLITRVVFAGRFDPAQNRAGWFRLLTIYTYYRRYANMKVDIETMRNAAGEASDLLKALANPHRLMIVCQLIEGPRSVGQLAEFLGIRDSTVSQHLALLRRDALLSATRDGQTIWYAISSPQAKALLETLYQLYCAPAPLCAPEAKPVTKSKRSTRK